MVRYTFNKRTTHCCRRNISSRVLLIFFSRASIKRCVKWIWNSRRHGKRERMREQNIQILDPVTNVWFGLHSSAPYGARDKFPTILYRLPFSRGQYWMTCLKSCLSCRPNPLWSNLCGNSGQVFIFFKLFVWRKVKHVHISSKSFCICNSSRFSSHFHTKKYHYQLAHCVLTSGRFNGT